MVLVMRHSSLPTKTERSVILLNSTLILIQCTQQYTNSHTVPDVQGDPPLKKKTQYALAAGSVLQHPYQGALYDVSLTDTHPAYRYSKPIFMGVTL